MSTKRVDEASLIMNAINWNLEASERASSTGDYALARHHRENVNQLCVRARTLGGRGAQVARDVELRMTE